MRLSEASATAVIPAGVAVVLVVGAAPVRVSWTGETDSESVHLAAHARYGWCSDGEAVSLRAVDGEAPFEAWLL